MMTDNILPADIERRSMEIIESEIGDMSAFSEHEKLIVKRCVHTTADFDYADNLYFSPGAVEAFCALLKKGATVITDTNMMTLRLTSDTPWNTFRIMRSVMKNMEELTQHVSSDMVMEVLQEPSIPTTSDSVLSIRPRMIKAAIFDLDNTLYDFDTPHRVALDAMVAFAERAAVPS